MANRAATLQGANPAMARESSSYRYAMISSEVRRDLQGRVRGLALFWGIRRS